MKRALMAAILICWASTAKADIIEWRDADGVSHYTNLASTIPKEQEGATRVVVDEAARRATGGTTQPTTEDPVPPAPEPQKKVEVISEPSEVTEAYVRGLLRGLDAASSVAAGGGGGSVQISGPLAVASATAPQPAYDSSWWYPGGFYPAGLYAPGFYPFGFFPGVATSFRGGRSHRGHGHPPFHDRLAFGRNPPSFFETHTIPAAGPPPIGIDPSISWQNWARGAGRGGWAGAPSR